MAPDARISKYLAEALGTYFLVLTIGCNVLGGSGVWAVTSIASSLMVCIFAFGAASGAHFNPSVTLAVYLSGKLPGGLKELAFYSLSQVAGGLLAALSYLFLFGASFDLGPGKGHSWLVAASVELIYTCMLCFVVLNVACASASQGNQFFALAIGFVIIAGGYAAGSISGAAFNPAVAFAIDLSSADKSFGMCGIYLVAEFLGSALAVLLFKLTRPEEFGDTANKNSLLSRLFAEAIGTYFLTLTAGLNVLKGSAAGAWSVAASLMCMIYSLGNCSGGHFNPAVTLAVLLSKRNKIDPAEASYYIVAQIIGAITAGLTYISLLGMSAPLNPGSSWGRTTMAETLYTTLLCLVVLSTATVNKPSKDFFGLAIGAVVTVAGFAGAPFGVVLNPAVSIGFDVSNSVKGGTFGHSLLFTGMEMAGAGIAAGLFGVLYPDEYRERGLKV